MTGPDELGWIFIGALAFVVALFAVLTFLLDTPTTTLTVPSTFGLALRDEIVVDGKLFQIVDVKSSTLLVVRRPRRFRR